MSKPVFFPLQPSGLFLRLTERNHSFSLPLWLLKTFLFFNVKESPPLHYFSQPLDVSVIPKVCLLQTQLWKTPTHTMPVFTTEMPLAPSKCTTLHREDEHLPNLKWSLSQSTGRKKALQHLACKVLDSICSLTKWFMWNVELDSESSFPATHLGDF